MAPLNKQASTPDHLPLILVWPVLWATLWTCIRLTAPDSGRFRYTQDGAWHRAASRVYGYTWFKSRQHPRITTPEATGTEMALQAIAKNSRYTIRGFYWNFWGTGHQSTAPYLAVPQRWRDGLKRAAAIHRRLLRCLAASTSVAHATGSQFCATRHRPAPTEQTGFTQARLASSRCAGLGSGS